MATAKNFTGHLLKFTFMWVMGLWAVTLPGQEIDVYYFLLGSAAVQTVEEHTTTSQCTQTPSFRQKPVEAFQDARPSSGISTSYNGYLQAHLPASFAFTPFVNLSIPASELTVVFRQERKRLYLGSLQANAP